MSIELNEYFSQNLPREIIISKTVEPLLQTIKRNHINSYLQLKSSVSPNKDQRSDISKERENIFRLNQKEKMLSKVDDRTAMRRTYKQSKRQKGEDKKYQTFYETNRSINTSYRDSPGFAYNEREKFNATSLKERQSKIKKHLIQSIDFQEIQKALYKKPHIGNMYEAFCNHIKNKNEEKQKQNRTQKSPDQESKTKSRIPKLLDHDEAVKKNKDYPFCTLDSAFRITNRKKFWKRDNSLQNKSLYNPEELKLSISPMKISFVEKKRKKIRLNEQI